VAKVEIYTSPFCGFCYRAKGLLENKGVDFDEIDITFHPSRHSEMLGRANGQRTVPQIFVDDKHVGGCDDLYALDSRGELDTILS
jgi:glutaredoxin 3